MLSYAEKFLTIARRSWRKSGRTGPKCVSLSLVELFSILASACELVISCTLSLHSSNYIFPRMLDELQKKIDDFTVCMDKITDLQVKICELTDPPSESEPLFSYFAWCSLNCSTIPHMVNGSYTAILRSLKKSVMELFVDVSKKDVSMNNCLRRCRWGNTVIIYPMPISL